MQLAVRLLGDIHTCIRFPLQAIWGCSFHTIWRNYKVTTQPTSDPLQHYLGPKMWSKCVHVQTISSSTVRHLTNSTKLSKQQRANVMQLLSTLQSANHTNDPVTMMGVPRLHVIYRQLWTPPKKRSCKCLMDAEDPRPAVRKCLQAKCCPLESRWSICTYWSMNIAGLKKKLYIENNMTSIFQQIMTRTFSIRKHTGVQTTTDI